MTRLEKGMCFAQSHSTMSPRARNKQVTAKSHTITTAPWWLKIIFIYSVGDKVDNISVLRHMSINAELKIRGVLHVTKSLFDHISYNNPMLWVLNETILLSTNSIGFDWIIRQILWAKELYTPPYLDL